MILETASTRSLVLVVADTISIFVDVWIGLDVLSDLALALTRSHDRLRPSESWPTSATELLLEFDAAGCASSEIKHSLGNMSSVPVREFVPTARCAL